MKRGEVVKYINVIVAIFIAFISQILLNIETAFEVGIIIIATSLVMIVFNVIESWKIYKVENIEKCILSSWIIFVWLIIAILGGIVIYNSLMYSEIMQIFH